MRMRRCWLVLAMSSVFAEAQISDPPELSQRLQSLMDARFAATKCPGLSVAVASHNKIILSKAWGKADLEQNVPMTTASVDRLASLSKPITGDSAICDYFARVTGLVTESHNAAASLT